MAPKPRLLFINCVSSTKACCHFVETAMKQWHYACSGINQASTSENSIFASQLPITSQSYKSSNPVSIFNRAGLRLGKHTHRHSSTHTYTHICTHSDMHAQAHTLTFIKHRWGRCINTCTRGLILPCEIFGYSLWLVIASSKQTTNICIVIHFDHLNEVLCY